MLWRERALAAELVSRMLQRNLDDLRANLEDLRVSTPRVPISTANGVLDPWRRFLQDLYLKYVRRGEASDRGYPDDTKSADLR